MMDFLLKYAKSPSQIRAFLAEIFECPDDRIKVFSMDEFNNLTEKLDYSILYCVGVFFSVHGDASQLLHLYGCRTSESDTIDRIVNTALKNKIHIYIPYGNFNGWIYVDGNEIKYVKELYPDEDEEDEGDCFYFSAPDQAST